MSKQISPGGLKIVRKHIFKVQHYYEANSQLFVRVLKIFMNICSRTKKMSGSYSIMNQGNNYKCRIKTVR